MSVAPVPSNDDLPPVDILKLADEIILEGSRKETGVSQREIRAMAAGLLGISVVLGQAGLAISLLAQMKAGQPKLRQKAEEALLTLADDLAQHGYLEESHVQLLRSKA